MKKAMVPIRPAAILGGIVVSIGVLTACSLPLPGPSDRRPEATITVQSATEPTPAPVSTRFAGVSLSFDPAVAFAANGATLPDTSDPTTPPEVDKGPARVAFGFDGYTGPSGTIPAFVYVYNLADLAGKPEEAMAAGLATLLQERPDLASQLQLPFLPFMNAGQALHAREAYRDFAGGAGIEAIVMFAQDAYPITGERLWYSFQGMTTDGQHYVSAVFPLRTDLFPAEMPADFNYDEWIAGYDQVMADARQALADAPANRFTPALDQLGALVQSIALAPGAAPAAAAPAEPAVTGFTGTYTATLPAADTPGRAVALTLNPDGTATMSTDYMNGEPPIVETGTWTNNVDATATVTFTQVGDTALPTPDVITFALVDDSLVAVTYDAQAYGAEGLTLQKAGSAEAGTPDVAEAVAPAETMTGTQPAPEAAAPVDAAAPAEVAAPNELVGVTWQLQEIRRANGLAVPVADPAKYTLAFSADGAIAVVADCNTGAGTYEIDGATIELRRLDLTRTACPYPSLDRQFAKVLEYVDSYAIEDGILVLSYNNSAGTLVFAPGTP